MIRTVVFMVVSLAATGWAALAPVPHFTVQLSVQASGISQDAVVRDLTTEFRKLGDVQVVTDESGLWLILINMTPIMDSKGLKGYALSTVIGDRYSSRSLETLPSADFKTPTVEKTVKELSEHLVYVQEQSVTTSTVADLPHVYAKLISHFDQEYLMPVREDVEDYNHGRLRMTRPD